MPTESKQAYTPGPWHAEFPSDHRGTVKIRSEILFDGATSGVEVAQIVGRLGYKGDAPCGNYQANARLISRAPEMAELLREQTSAMNNCPMGDLNYAGIDWHRRAAQLLAEIEGAQ